MQNINGDFKGKSILSVNQFTKEDIHILFKETSRLEDLVKSGAAIKDQEGRILSNLFYESSTRTSSSFAAAMQRLGGSVVSINDVSYSSVSKGETLEDTVRTLEAYTDIVALRHPEEGSAATASKKMRKPLINAGDGTGEHPTQALLDLFTIYQKKGKLSGLDIALLGDLKHGRTVHSLARLLALYDNSVTYVSPGEFAMPSTLVEELNIKGLQQKTSSSLKDCIKQQDVIYATRIQEERLASGVDKDKLQDDYRISIESMKEAKADSIVMHPLPRVGEIDPLFDDDQRAVYFDQVENGMYVRMALINLVLGRVS